MPKKVFFTDVDGTLLDLYQATGNVVRMMHDFKGVIGYPLHYSLADTYGIPESDLGKMFYYTWKEPAELYLGACEFVDALHDVGYRVLGVTYRPTEDAKIASIRDTQPLDLDGLFTCDTEEEKVDTIAEKSEGRPCYLLEDKVQMAIQVARQVPNCRVFLINRPWNHAYDVTKFYHRVWSFAAAVDGARYFDGRPSVQKA